MSSLVVDTNLSALQALNDLNATDNSMTTAIKRLSSGLKIQTAATGPAQYVISQALESQSNGYNTAIQNAQDGVSMIQTASGALGQISSILQTMDQLALTSANGATQTTTSYTANQAEFKDLLTSIDEIAKTTTFGQQKLLVTGFSGTLQVGAFNKTTQQIKLTITSVTSAKLGLTGTAAVAKSGNITLTTGKVTLTTTVTFTIKVGKTSTTTYTVKVAKGSYTLTTLAAQVNKVAGSKVTASVVALTGATAGKYQLDFTTVATGATAKVVVKAKASGTGTTAATLGLTATKTGTGSGSGSAAITTVTKAQKAITAIQAALKTVDTLASKVGATQNELQAIVANLTVGQQNLQAANSQLVDVNMAQEMTTFSTDQILMQTGVSMLAQAQQAPSLVLKLI